MNVPDSEIRTLLTNVRKIAVYGLSPDAAKPSFYVPEYMRSGGRSSARTRRCTPPVVFRFIPH